MNYELPSLAERQYLRDPRFDRSRETGDEPMDWTKQDISGCGGAIGDIAIGSAWIATHCGGSGGIPVAGKVPIPGGTLITSVSPCETVMRGRESPVVDATFAIAPARERMQAENRALRKALNEERERCAGIERINAALHTLLEISHRQRVAAEDAAVQTMELNAYTAACTAVLRTYIAEMRATFATLGPSEPAPVTLASPTQAVDLSRAFRPWPTSPAVGNRRL